MATRRQQMAARQWFGTNMFNNIGSACGLQSTTTATDMYGDWDGDIKITEPVPKEYDCYYDELRAEIDNWVEIAA